MHRGPKGDKSRAVPMQDRAGRRRVRRFIVAGVRCRATSHGSLVAPR
jgi:hypothetical protein